MTTQRPECYLCLHYLQAEVPPGVALYPRCEAYPDGIPEEIFFEGVPHREPRGDEEAGQVFTPKDEAAARETGVSLPSKEPQQEGRRFRRLPTI